LRRVGGQKEGNGNVWCHAGGGGLQKTVKLRIWGRVALVGSDDVDDSVFFFLIYEVV
jgi:hypothetical protein